ncbi:hypothetical protein HC251_19855 [Iamia sp. SCSIO 61187]|nr:hypothetical protein [Iamia sp. SCSIO 61187]QYG94466.1 hypothetical protein HC251_19855 [Iamia sp. SCSIO 61187]
MSGTYVPKPEWLVLHRHRACIEAESLTVFVEEAEREIDRLASLRAATR